MNCGEISFTTESGTIHAEIYERTHIVKLNSENCKKNLKNYSMNERRIQVETL